MYTDKELKTTRARATAALDIMRKLDPKKYPDIDGRIMVGLEMYVAHMDTVDAEKRIEAEENEAARSPIRANEMKRVIKTSKKYLKFITRQQERLTKTMQGKKESFRTKIYRDGKKAVSRKVPVAVYMEQEFGMVDRVISENISSWNFGGFKIDGLVGALRKGQEEINVEIAHMRNEQKTINPSGR